MLFCNNVIPSQDGLDVYRKKLLARHGVNYREHIRKVDPVEPKGVLSRREMEEYLSYLAIKWVG